MITQNLHAHSTWDDGRSSVEAMILTSRDAGLKSVGLSAHCPLPYANGWSCPRSLLPGYIAQVRALKEKYAGEIDVYLGLEWDVMATDIDLSPYDYVIGSAHALPIAGCPSVDECLETTARFVQEAFGGDADAAAEAYFAEVAKVADAPRAQIVGHFDLITKFQEQRRIFDERSPRYRRAAEAAMARLVAAGKIFEVNTGAISRGYRSTPYPARPLLLLLREMGGKVTVSADAHHVSGVTCAFEEAEKLIRDCGFTQVWTLQGNAFVPETL